MNDKKENINIKEQTIKRIGGYLHRVVPIADVSGEILSYVLKPLMVEFKPRDIIQVIVGATILATPIALSEEAWNLASDLESINIASICLLSILFIGLFVYFNFYRFNLKGHVFNYVKRVIGTYIISLIVVAMILLLFDKLPWESNSVLALKRLIIVAFPAAMSGTLSDSLK